MLATVIIFAIISVITEIILLMHLPLWLRRSRWLMPLAVIVTLVITVLNFWVGFGTVTGTLTAKLAFVGGFIAYPVTKWLSREVRWPELSVLTRVRLALWLGLRGRKA